MHGRTPNHTSAAVPSSKRSRDHVELECAAESGQSHDSSSCSAKKMKTKVGDDNASMIAGRELTNTSDKPYSYHACGKAFARSDALTRHLRVHSGDKPHSCHACGKAFATSGKLTRHLRVHSGDKPYSCHACGKAYSGSSSLKKHMHSCC